MRVEPSRWLRAAVIAAVVAAACVTIFDLTVSERVVDRAVAHEQSAASGHALAVPEQFTRREQRGGLVLAELFYALGAAATLAGCAILLGRTRDAPRRWALLAAAGAWSLVLAPALVLPPLPPGAATTASIEARRATFVAAVVIALLGAAGAAWAWRRARRRTAGVRLLAATSALVASALMIVVALPSDRAVGHVDSVLVRDFRLASFASQGIFWLACAAAGSYALLRQAARGSQ